MPFQRHIRLVVSGAMLVGAVAVGLADWAGRSPSSYVVQPGDSLWAIATSHGLTVSQLAAANRLNPDDILLIGTHIYLPSGPTRRGSTHVLRAASVTSSATPAADFCSSLSSDGGPYGALPARLSGSDTYRHLAPLFRHWARHYGVSLALVEAVAWQESGWQQSVVSDTGAIGVGQIEPYTATFISSLTGLALDPTSVSDNIRMSAAFLAYLSRVEGGNRCATIAAYYEGPLMLQTRGVLPDTQQYVADVEALLPRFE